MDKTLLEWANSHGYRIAWGNAKILNEIRKEIEGRRTEGELDEDFYRKWLSRFHYLENVELPGVKTVIVVAIPRPAHRITFQLESGAFQAVLPPTYGWYDETSLHIQKELGLILLGYKYRLTALRAPLKALAARMGLVAYGRNNITYASGLGSYHQLVGFLTDAELEPMTSIDTPNVSQGCRNCEICLHACPTGAIGENRFLLHAERCLTLFSELPDPWPEWLPPSAHNCLIGCLICQKVCPKNKGLLNFESIEVSFDAEETAIILAEGTDETGPVWDGIKAKLDSIGLSGYEPVIGRNLRALIYISQ